MKNNIKTFAGLEENKKNYSSSDVVILPIPYEKTTTYIKGTEYGPQAILDASPNLEFYDEELDFVAIDHAKITTLSPLLIKDAPEQMVINVSNVVENIVKDKKLPIVLGGEHSITVGAFQGIKKYYNNISVVQFDAHADLRESYEGSRFNHACVMRRICEDAHICQIGIRAIDKEEAQFMQKKKLDVFFARDIVGKTDWHEKALQGVKDNVYITFDLDVFDCSLMPATGTPEPGGLFWYDALHFLKELIFKKNIVGMDVVELCPLSGNRAPDFIASKILYKMISYYSYKKTLSKKDSLLQ